MKPRDPGRRDAPGKVLKERRSPRQRGRMGTSVRRTHLRVALVADERDGHVRVRVLPRVLEPGREVLERVASRDVVHEQRARGAAVLTPRDGT